MIDKQPLRRMLNDLQFAPGAPESTFDELSVKATLVDFAAGTVIFLEGNENPCLYLVHTGHVGLDIQVPGRGRVRILSVGPGELIAWSALLSDGTMTVSATAVEDTQVIALPAADLLDLSERNYEVGYVLMSHVARALAQRLSATRLQLLDLFADPGARGG